MKKLTQEELNAKIEAGDRDFYNLDLTGLNFSGVKIPVEANFTNSLLIYANFKGAELPYPSFYRVNAESAYFAEASIKSADFTKANLQEANFTDANLNKASFVRTELQGATFKRANAKEVGFFKSNMKKANLSYAKFLYSSFDAYSIKQAYIEGVVFEENSFFFEKHDLDENPVISNPELKGALKELIKTTGEAVATPPRRYYINLDSGFIKLDGNFKDCRVYF